MFISAVIPVYNEVESLEKLHQEIDAVATAEGYELQIVFVDDGSRDGSWDVIRRLAEQDPRVRGIRFRRNFGKAAALTAGFDVAKGDFIFTLDADLQDDPKEMPRFLTEMGTEFDLVSGWKRRRHDPWHKVFPSRVFNRMVSWLTGVKLHDHNCGMKCYRRDVLGEVRIYGEMHRFVPVLAAARGFRIGEIAIAHRARQFGHSKYGVKRFIKGFLDLLTVKFLTGYGQRPQHILGVIGLMMFTIGGLALSGLAGWWVLSRTITALGPPVHLHERAVFFYSLGALLLGGQFVSVGLLAEMVTAFMGREADTYSISEETDPCQQKSTHERTA